MSYDLTPDKPADGEPTKEEPGQGPLVPQASLPEGVLLTAQDIVQNDWADIALLGAKSSDYNPLVNIDAYLHKTWRPAARAGMYVYVGNRSDKDLYTSLKNAAEEAEKERLEEIQRQREQAREDHIASRAAQRLNLLTHDLPHRDPLLMTSLLDLLTQQEQEIFSSINPEKADHLQKQIDEMVRHMIAISRQKAAPPIKLTQDDTVKIWKEPFNI